MRDGRFATPRFNAAVDGAPMLRARCEVAWRKSVELKQDFFEILAYITRCDNRTRSPSCARAASGHAAAAPPSSVMKPRHPITSMSTTSSPGGQFVLKGEGGSEITPCRSTMVGCVIGIVLGRIDHAGDRIGIVLGRH